MEKPHVNLAAIRARNEARTQGEWTTESANHVLEVDIAAPDVPGEGSPNIIASMIGIDDEDVESARQAARDARFIAACSTDIPALLALVAWQQDIIRDVNQHLPEHEYDCAKFDTVQEDCTCGLDALRKQIEEAVG